MEDLKICDQTKEQLMLFCLGKAIRWGVIDACKSLSPVSPTIIDLTQSWTQKMSKYANSSDLWPYLIARTNILQV